MYLGEISHYNTHFNSSNTKYVTFLRKDPGAESRYWQETLTVNDISPTRDAQRQGTQNGFKYTRKVTRETIRENSGQLGTIKGPGTDGINMHATTEADIFIRPYSVL